MAQPQEPREREQAPIFLVERFFLDVIDLMRIAAPLFMKPFAACGAVVSQGVPTKTLELCSTLLRYVTFRWALGTVLNQLPTTIKRGCEGVTDVCAYIFFTRILEIARSSTLPECNHDSS